MYKRQGLAGATDAEIAQIVKSMGEVSAGKDAMADAKAGADTEVQAAICLLYTSRCV